MGDDPRLHIPVRELQRRKHVLHARPLLRLEAMAEASQNISENISLINDWINAVNEKNIEKVVRLSSEDSEIVGPRGSARGRDVLSDWIARAGIRLQTLRRFANSKHVAIEQQAAWESPQTEGRQSTALVSTHFTIAGVVISRIARFDSLQPALEDASLSEQDEIAQ